MGVVDVDGHLVREDGPVVAVGVDELLHRELYGRGGEEVLLLQAQLLALVAVVVGVEDLGDDLRQLPLLHGLHVLAAVEVAHVDLVDGLGAPGAQEVDLGAVIAHHGDVVGHGLHGLVVQVAVVGAAVVLIGFDAAAEVDLHRVLGMGDLPDVAAGQPVVGHLDLIAVHQLLAEQAEFIADGAAHGGQLQRGQGIQEAGGEAAQAAVAQAGLRLLLEHHGAVDAQLVQGLHIIGLVDQVDHVVVQRAAHQEFGAEVVDLLGLLLLAGVAGIAAALHDLVAHHQGQGLVQLLRGGVGHVAGKLRVQLVEYALLDLFNGHPFKIHKNTSEKIRHDGKFNRHYNTEQGFCNGMCVYFLGENAHLWAFLPFVHGDSTTTLQNDAAIGDGRRGRTRGARCAPQFCHSGCKFAISEFKKCKFNL